MQKRLTMRMGQFSGIYSGNFKEDMTIVISPWDMQTYLIAIPS